MRLPKATYKITTTFVLAFILFCSSNAKSQVTQDCTYGAQLDKVNHFLDSVTASKWINHYQQYLDSIRQGLTKFDPNIFPNPQESFNRRLIQQILDVTGCIGQRDFMGINDQGKMVVILGGIDNCGNTLYITNDKQTLRINNNGGSNVRTLAIPSSGGDKGLGEFGQYP
jgi:hypothetical protein